MPTPYWRRAALCLVAGSALSAAGLPVPAGLAQTNQVSKASRIAHDAARKSDFGLPKSAKSDLAGPGPDRGSSIGNKGGSAAEDASKASATMAGGAFGKVDLLDLLLPSDPHVEEDSPADEKQPARASEPDHQHKRKAASGTRKPIGIAHKKGRLVLNRFHTMKLTMDHKECREFPDIVMADYQLPAAAIETLADNMAIIQKQMCASNGLVVFTCYQNEATISLRRARPDDGCKR